MYAYVAQKYNIDITHIYFEVGHTHNEGDSMHSVIEKIKQNQVIYVPDQWIICLYGVQKLQVNLMLYLKSVKTTYLILKC